MAKNLYYCGLMILKNSVWFKTNAVNKQSPNFCQQAEVRTLLFWWAIRDSNPGPTGYEPVALTN